MLIDLVKANRSYRGYDHSRAVTKDELLKMVEAARFCPSSVNVQPLKYCLAYTPEVVAAAYRTADPCTNIITPAMTYAGVILLFCRRYKPEFTLGDLGLMMAPYAGIFLVVATAVMLLWFKLGLPFGC